MYSYSFTIPLGDFLLSLVKPTRQRNSFSRVGGQHLVHHVTEKVSKQRACKARE